MQEKLDAWHSAVGDTESTLHWCGDALFARVAHMNSMSLDELKRELSVGSLLDRSITGIMDLMFVTSCLEFTGPSVMGTLFWAFAREIIRVRVSCVDQLNLLLWKRPLAQTILVLDPVPFFIDSMVPYIETVLSIQGTIVRSNEQDSHEGSTARTILMIASTSTLLFRNSVSLSALQVIHVEASGSRQMEYALSFVGNGLAGLSLALQAVEVRNGGCFVTHYHQVNANHFGVINASTGFNARNVDQLFITATHKRLADIGFDSCFLHCEVALNMVGVSTFVGTGLTVAQCHVICDAKIKKIFVLENSHFEKCFAWGEILSSPTCTPSLYNNEVFCVFLCEM